MRKEANFRKICRINGHEIFAEREFGIFHYPVLLHRFNILGKDVLVLSQAHNLNNRFKFCHVYKFFSPRRSVRARCWVLNRGSSNSRPSTSSSAISLEARCNRSTRRIQAVGTEEGALFLLRVAIGTRQNNVSASKTGMVVLNFSSKKIAR